MRLIPTLLTLAFGLGLAAPVGAMPSTIWWPEWSVESTENLALVENGSKPLLHSLTALFEANPRTTWVMNPRAELQGIFVDKEQPRLEKQFFSQTKRGLLISGKARWVSGLRIMNGDNSSRRAFENGNRILRLEVTLIDGQKHRNYTLPLKDRMGWQRVFFPRQRAEKIAIEFVELLKAKKPVCVSALGLLDGARRIKWNMPQLVLFRNGSGAPDTELLNRRGEFINYHDDDYAPEIEWSKDGRFVAGFHSASGEATWNAKLNRWNLVPLAVSKTGEKRYDTSYAWVADVKRGKIIRRIEQPQRGWLYYQWIGARQLQTKFYFRGAREPNKPFQTKIYRF